MNGLSTTKALSWEKGWLTRLGSDLVTNSLLNRYHPVQRMKSTLAKKNEDFIIWRATRTDKVILWYAIDNEI